MKKRGETMEDHVRKTIEDTNILFHAIQTEGNAANRKVSYNKPYEFLPGLNAT